jgi:glycosyltransferase involved in cell wall biosynthesis
VEELARAIAGSGVRAVSIQYNFGFFAPPDLGLLVDRVKDAGIVTAVTLHAVQHANFPQLKAALRHVDFCICHRPADVQAMSVLGVQNVLLRKQGIVTPPPAAAQHRLHFVVSCFGFFLPPKGIYQLIQAFALARAVQPLLRLKLLNALYPVPESAAYARECLRLIQEKGLGGDVEVSTGFLPHEETLRALAESDLVVLPYLHSTESSSAAGAFALASLTPVLCSDLPLFDELAEVLHRFPAGDVFALANRILQLAEDRGELQRYRKAQEARVRELAWPAVARDFAELIAARVTA